MLDSRKSGAEGLKYENRPEGVPERDKELEREVVRKALDMLSAYDFIKFKQTIPFFNEKRPTVEERADQLITDLKALFPLGERIYGKDWTGVGVLQSSRHIDC
jgi:hypothetical protein